MTRSPVPAPTLSTATIVLEPGRNLVGSFSSTSCGRRRSSLRPFMAASFLVETTDPSTRAKNMARRWLVIGREWLEPLRARRAANGQPRTADHGSLFLLGQHLVDLV